METLKEHRARLMVRHVDMSTTPLKTVIQGRAQYLTMMPSLGESKTTVPEHEALWFYLRNHGMAAIERAFDPAEPLGEWAEVVVDYHKMLQASGLRMYYYLLQICTRESRHAKNSDVLWAKHPKLKAWYMTYRGTSSDGAVNALLTDTPDVTVGELTQFLVDSFYKCNYHGGYGGKKWGAIADVLDQFVHGRITGEMMLDTAWTLCHNNGPIFNKGMWYDHYSSYLQEILDVQRGGAIPQYIRDVTDGVPLSKQYNAGKFVKAEMRSFVDRLSALSTDFLGGVDWLKVKKLGAIGSYQNLIDMQAKAKPLTPAQKAAAKKEALLKQQAEAEAKAKLANQWQIMPGVHATKIKVRPVAA